jgi:hypothetical protein
MRPDKRFWIRYRHSGPIRGLSRKQVRWILFWSTLNKHAMGCMTRMTGNGTGRMTSMVLQG